MSVFIPSGYADRDIDHHTFVTFYSRDTLKRLLTETLQVSNAFAKASGAASMHVYSANTWAHWHPVGDIHHNVENALSYENTQRLKKMLSGFGRGAMVVVARNSQNGQAHEEKLAQSLRNEGLIQSAEQFLVVEPAPLTQLKQGRLVSHLQLSC